MSELTANERATVESIVAGVQRRNSKRRQASRTGWALLATAAIALPVIASAMDGAITLTTALTRIGLALVISLFVATALGSLVDAYQTEAALRSVEDALRNARRAAEEAARAVSDSPAATALDAQEAVTDAADDSQ